MIPPTAPTAPKLAALERAVHARLGLDAQRIGKHALRQAIVELMLRKSLSDGDAYVDRVLGESAEFAALVDQLVVAETWFFRDRRPFHCIQRYVREHVRPWTSAEPLRALSLPCSSGEEAYSMAMVLLAAGVPADAMRVDAADVSGRLLTAARQGLYGRASFRGDEVEFADLCKRDLEPEGDRIRVSVRLREALRFVTANLIDPALSVELGRYQLILCRNVLIYMHDEARRQALLNLHRLLLPGGLLYVGHVEAQLVREAELAGVGSGPRTANDSAARLDARGFTPFAAEFPSAFIVTAAGNAAAAGLDPPGMRDDRPWATGRDRPASRHTPAGASLPTTTSEGISRSRAGEAIVPPALPPVSDTAARAESPPSPVADLLTRARLAADSGLLQEAYQLCRDVTDRDPTQVEAVFLMGLVAKADGKISDAQTLFRRVLYLDARHEQALIHMMLLAQHQGDQVAAVNFRRRLEQLRGCD